MTRPNTPKGYRKLVVREQSFRWRFFPLAKDSELVVLGDPRPPARLVVVLLGWSDPWLSFGDVGPPEPVGPALIGPAFARSAVEWALDAGWRLDARGKTTRLEWASGAFTGVTSGDANAASSGPSDPTVVEPAEPFSRVRSRHFPPTRTPIASLALLLSERGSR